MTNRKRGRCWGQASSCLRAQKHVLLTEHLRKDLHSLSGLCFNWRNLKSNAVIKAIPRDKLFSVPTWTNPVNSFRLNWRLYHGTRLVYTKVATNSICFSHNLESNTCFQRCRNLHQIKASSSHSTNVCPSRKECEALFCLHWSCDLIGLAFVSLPSLQRRMLMFITDFQLSP